VAKRIAEKLNMLRGDVIGYKVRFQDRFSRDVSVKLMTDGILRTAPSARWRATRPSCVRHWGCRVRRRWFAVWRWAGGRARVPTARKPLVRYFSVLR